MKQRLKWGMVDGQALVGFFRSLTVAYVYPESDKGPLASCDQASVRRGKLVLPWGEERVQVQNALTGVHIHGEVCQVGRITKPSRRRQGTGCLIS